MTASRFNLLMNQYKTNRLSAAEREELLDFVQNEEEQRWLHLLEEMMAHSSAQDTVPGKDFIARELEKVLEIDRSRRKGILQTKPAGRVVSFGKYAAVAAVLLLLTVGYVWFKSNNRMHKADSRVITGADVSAGSDGAVLTLADGSQMVLDSMGNGLVTTQNGIRVTLKNGQLFYEQTNGAITAEMAYNTMTTPRGRQFRVTLPDGSLVWLNAASSIRYPTLFNGKERRVDITGEAFFEIAENKNMPFVAVVANKAEIQVMGTSFNINAYDEEEAMYATLLTGRVAVQKNGQQLLLSPGSQARIAGGISQLPNVDTAQIMAWKNGAFNFENLSLKQAMRQLQRWYNIEVIYEDEVPDELPFTGKISRKVSLKHLLELLKGTDLKFRLGEGNKLIIKK